MTAPRKFAPTTVSSVLLCIDCGMSQTRAAEVLNVRVSALQQASALFGWKWHGITGNKKNKRNLPAQQGAHNPFAL